jgi:hypothetical protein
MSTVAVLVGCASTGDAKKFTVLRLHLETNRDGTDQTKPVPIYRNHPFQVVVQNSPFLTEANVSGAKLIETLGGYSLEVTFERRGMWLLEQYSTSNKGKRVAIFSEFRDPADKDQVVARWLGAPMIMNAVTNGVLTFTPDANREECTNIVNGLNKLAKKLNDSYSW